jgi:hypothetical protein
LLIDLDLQALLSQCLGIPVSELEESVYSVMRRDADLGRVTRGAALAEEAANERKEEESPKRGSRGGGRRPPKRGHETIRPKRRADNPQAGAGQTGQRAACADFKPQA